MTTEHGLPDDDATRALARVLHAEVDDLEVSGDSLARIQARTDAGGGRTSWRWIAPLSAAAVVAVIAAGVVLLPGAGSPTATPGTPPSTTPSVTSPPSTSPTPSSHDCVIISGPYIPVPSYFVRTFEGRSALYREFLPFQHCSTASPAPSGPPVVMQAVSNMAQPEKFQLDEQTLWPAGLEVTALRRDGDRATITLNAGPTGDPTLAMQQLVYTVTAADNTIRAIGVELPGGSDDVLYTRAPAIEVLAPVWLINATTEDTPEGYVIHFDGVASVFEATVNWQITDEKGKVVDSGHAMTPEAAPARGPWKATSKPLPKDHYYTVTAYEASPQDGRMTWPDSRTTP